MTKLLLAVMGSAALLSGGLALADDSNTDRPITTYKQKMKSCMDKERMQNHDATDADLKKTCSSKIQSYDQHPSETKTPPNNPT